MHVAIVGAGPVGTTAALLLARGGHRITLLDRDPGPITGSWRRRGVMQFHQPHGFRTGFREALLHRLPDVYRALLDAGAVVRQPDDPAVRSGVAMRRSVLERTLWAVADAEPGITRVTGNIDAPVVDDGRVVGVRLGRWTVRADLVIDASGRAGRWTDQLRPAVARTECGMAYVSRLYRFEPGRGHPSLAGGPVFLGGDGYFVLVFPSDAGTFTVLIVRPTRDRDLAALRDIDVFESVVSQLPLVGDMTSPDRAHPLDQVRAGAGLINSYRPQAGCAGLLAIGDAVLCTNPMGGRGVTLGVESAVAMTDIVEHAVVEAWSTKLDAWCEQHLRPWFADHVEWDDALHAAWAGLDLDPDGPLSMEVLVAAGRHRPELMADLEPYLDMRTTPETTSAVRAQVRAMIRAGWRPAPGDVELPGRARLLALIDAASRSDARVA